MTEVCELMDEVRDLMAEHMPDQYHERTPRELSRDPLGKAWVDASKAVDNASDFLGDLGDMLREKAGITLEEAKAGIAKTQEEPASAEAVRTGG